MQYLIDSTTALLKTVTVANGAFVDTTKTLTKAGAAFSTDLTTGDTIDMSGTDTAANDGTFTVTDVAATTITFAETIVTDSDSAAILNEYYMGAWFPISLYLKLRGAIFASQNCTGYIDQGNVTGTVDYTDTVAVTGGSPAAIDINVRQPFARLRIKNGGTDQTVLRAYMNGQTGC